VVLRLGAVEIQTSQSGRHRVSLPRRSTVIECGRAAPRGPKLAISAIRQKSRRSSAQTRSIMCYDPTGLPVQACSHLLHLHESSTAGHARGPCPLWGQNSTYPGGEEACCRSQK
jgi:hypothetical protein